MKRMVGLGILGLCAATAGFFAYEASLQPVPARPAPPQPITGMRCTTIIVGRHASADGSVLIGHNEDLGNASAHHYVFVPGATYPPGSKITLWSGIQIPQVAQTFSYNVTKIFDINYNPGDISSGINEHQVSIANNMAFQRLAANPGPYEGRILWSEFSRLTLERARTAREGIQIIGDLVSTYKIAFDPGTMFGVTDPVEGWWIEVTQDGQWVAQRVPEDRAEMRANAYRIGIVNFDDPANFLYSPDLVSYAESRGWHKPGTPFNFSLVYGDPFSAKDPSNTHRQTRIDNLLNQSLPTLKPLDIAAMLRDHYEGTPLDTTDHYRLGSPHHTKENTVCNLNTEISSVCQSRSWLPADIGAVCWRALATPCSTAFVPWYSGHEVFPAEFQRGTNTPSSDSAYWAFRNLVTATDADYGNRIPIVHDTWATLEANIAVRQATIETNALIIRQYNPVQAKSYLAHCSSTWGTETFADAPLVSSCATPTALPAEVTNLGMTRGADSTLHMTWDSAPGAVAYDVFRSPQPDLYLADKIGSSDSTFFNEPSGGPSGPIFFYQIRGKNLCAIAGP